MKLVMQEAGFNHMRSAQPSTASYMLAMLVITRVAHKP